MQFLEPLEFLELLESLELLEPLEFAGLLDKTAGDWNSKLNLIFNVEIQL